MASVASAVPRNESSSSSSTWIIVGVVLVSIGTLLAIIYCYCNRYQGAMASSANNSKARGDSKSRSKRSSKRMSRSKRGGSSKRNRNSRPKQSVFVQIYQKGQPQQQSAKGVSGKVTIAHSGQVTATSHKRIQKACS